MKITIIKKYLAIHKKAGRVTLAALKDAEVSRDQIKHHFGSLTKLDEAAREQFPDKFNDVKIELVANKKNKTKLSDAISKYKRFVITTAVTGCSVDKKALASVKDYCAKNKAKLLVLLCSDPAHKGIDSGTIDKDLDGELFISQDTELNDNFFISAIKTTAKQIDPTTGLLRVGQREGSFVYASPKQRLRVNATSNLKMPHCIMTSGAITKSNYSTDKYISERTAYLADSDHVMGAIVVEIVNSQLYHFRQIQFDKKGRFADLGKMYDGKSVQNYSPEALIPGDWHAGETDPKVKSVIFEMINKFKPNKVILHDMFNGMSINHHESKDLILRSIRSESGELNLLQELTACVADLNDFTKVVKETIVVKSNHDEFLARYLTECRFKDDPANLKIALRLALAMTDKKDPLRYAAEFIGLNLPSKVRWLDRDEDLTVAGIQCGAHGDKGSNGTRGSLAAMERAYSKSISGHSHTPGILRDAWSVGTSTHLKLSYNSGPSSWLQTLCLVYPNGMRQLINIIEGQYNLK